MLKAVLFLLSCKAPSKASVPVARMLRAVRAHCSQRPTLDCPEEMKIVICTRGKYPGRKWSQIA